MKKNVQSKGLAFLHNTDQNFRDLHQQNAENARQLQVSSKQATIAFNNVHFEYTPGYPIFKNLSFTVPTGKKIAIVGGSGSGWVQLQLTD